MVKGFTDPRVDHPAIFLWFLPFGPLVYLFLNLADKGPVFSVLFRAKIWL